jgi:formylmethanofuran:tetrahydromethanopterin formyltransferase
MIGRSASGDFTIQACRGTQATTCAAGYVPLCNADTNALTATTTAAAACSAAAENLGCLLQGGAVSQCAALSANRYPANGVTANPYKFVAAIQNAQTATLLACATMGENAGTPVTNCKVAATFTQKAYPAGECR